MDNKDKIELLKANLKKAEQAKTVAETQKAAATDQIADIEIDMASNGVTPATITAEIERLEKEIVEAIASVESLLPHD